MWILDHINSDATLISNSSCIHQMNQENNILCIDIIHVIKLRYGQFNDFLKKHRIISTVGKALGSAGLPYVEAIGNAAKILGYGKRKRVGVRRRRLVGGRRRVIIEDEEVI